MIHTENQLIYKIYSKYKSSTTEHIYIHRSNAAKAENMQVLSNTIGI